MTSLTQIPQRRRRTPHVEGCDRQWPQRGVVEHREQVGEHALDVFGPRLEQVEGAVAHTGILLGDLSGVADVGLTHLQEDPARDDQSQ